MVCKNCVHSMDEERVNALGKEGKWNKIKEEYNRGKSYLVPNLKKGQKCIFCAWSYLVLSDASICADYENAEDFADE